MFYQLSALVNVPKEVGTGYPQAHCLTQKEAAHRFMYDEFPNFNPDLRFELKKGAKLSDLLSQSSISARGLLISTQMKEWISSFNLGRHAFYPVKVFTRNAEEYNYYFLQILPLPMEVLDFGRSTFLLKDITTPVGEIVISSYDDYRIKKKEYGVLKVISMTKAVLNQSFDSTLDIFVLPIADGRILISDKLHISLKKKSFTGIEQKAVHTITHDALV